MILLKREMHFHVCHTPIAIFYTMVAKLATAVPRGIEPPLLP